MRKQMTLELGFVAPLFESAEERAEWAFAIRITPGGEPDSRRQADLLEASGLSTA